MPTPSLIKSKMRQTGQAVSEAGDLLLIAVIPI